jgi:hypothetical protein
VFQIREKKKHILLRRVLTTNMNNHVGNRSRPCSLADDRTCTSSFVRIMTIDRTDLLSVSLSERVLEVVFFSSKKNNSNRR